MEPVYVEAPRSGDEDPQGDGGGAATTEVLAPSQPAAPTKVPQKEWNWLVCETLACIGASLAASERKQHQTQEELNEGSSDSFKAES